jgi:hypothetical protein
MPFILKSFTPLVDFPIWLFEELNLMTELEDRCLDKLLTSFTEGKIGRDSFVQYMHHYLAKTPYTCLGFSFEDFRSWQNRCVDAARKCELRHPLVFCEGLVLVRTAAECWERYEVVQEERQNRIEDAARSFNVNILDDVYPELHTKIRSLLAAVDIEIFFNASDYNQVFPPIIFSTNFDYQGYLTTIYKRLANSDPESYRLFSGLSEENAADLFGS